MDTVIANINAYILTGGQSRRMIIDKSLVQLDGQTLTEIIHQNLESIFNNIYIVGKENHFPNFNFINDNKFVQCPLNGIVTALEHSQNDWIFVIACDLPLVEASIFKKLCDGINTKAQVIVPIVDDTLQPLCAFYHKSVLKIFNSAISKGEYSLMKLLDQIDTVKFKIPFDNEKQFLNINYPVDLEEAEKILKIDNN